MAGGQPLEKNMEAKLDEGTGEPLPPQVHAPPDAPEFQPRSSLPYEGPGCGQMETRLTEEAVTYGLGAIERRASERLGHGLGSQELPHPKPEEVKGKEVMLAPTTEEEGRPAAAT